MAIKAIRGFKDILPPESKAWQKMEEAARSNLESFGFSEIRTPILEKTEVFQRGIGEHTDIVEKEMYTFQDRNGEWVTLRPEATAGIIRAFLEAKLFNKGEFHKLFTIGPMFRYERPQKGRLRQFHQINAEILGASDPLADTEIIWLAWKTLKDFGIKDITLEVNSLGCPKCRPLHRKDLVVFLENNQEELCPECRKRSRLNPLRVFDCKKESCKNALLLAPTIKHYWCPDCAQHLGVVLDYLEALGIPFVINPHLVRGLDYYKRTTFEIKAKGLGAQDTIAAGGRYDGLSEELGGPALPGVGMAIGMERASLLAQGLDQGHGTQCFIAVIDREGMDYGLSWLKELRQRGIRAETVFGKKSLKAQMRHADRLGALLTVIVGEQELEEEEAVVRDMSTHEQTRVSFENVVDHVFSKVKLGRLKEENEEDRGD